MESILLFVGIIIAWIVLVRIVLPKLGINP